MTRNPVSNSVGFAGCAAMLLMIGSNQARADYPAEVLADGPLAYYRLNENLASPVYDNATNIGSLGSAATGHYSGATTHPVAGAIVSQPGNQAASFQGGSVGVTFQSGLNVSSPFTVELWTKPDDTGATKCVASSIKLGNSGWLFYNSLTAGQWTFRTIDGSSVNDNATGGTVTVGAWHHIVGVWDGTKNRLYVNGALVASNTAATTFLPVTDTTVPLTFGARSDNTFVYAGSIDEVAYYPSALSDSQILAHYQAGTNAAPGTPYNQVILANSPAGYWRLSDSPPSFPVAANSGSLGAAANANYMNGVVNSPGPASPAYPGFGASNPSGNFDGASGSVGTPLGLLNNRSNFTVMGWVKRGAVHSTRGGYFGQNNLLELGDATSGASIEAWFDAPGHNIVVAYPWADDEWGFIAITADGTTETMYLNGASAGTQTSAVTSYGTNEYKFNIGGGGIFNASGDFFKGNIDEVAVFNKVLKPGRVLSYFLTATGAQSAPFLVSDPPTLTPASGTIFATTPFTLTADVAAPSGTIYQWRKGGTAVSGGTFYTFTKASAAVSDSGNYDLVASNSFGAVTSSVVSVTVNAAAPPTITQQPATRSTYAGGTASFTVAATGTTPFTYQWKHAGTNLPGATNATVILSAVDSTKTGSYFVNVSNVAGNIDSTTATLSIKTPAPNSFEAALVSNGPIAYWRLGESSGVLAFDSIGGHDGVYNGGVTHVTGGIFSDGDGAANFNGTDAYVGTGAGLLNGLVRYTVTGWVRRAGTQANRTGLFGQNDNVEFGYISDQDIQCWDGQLSSAVDAPNSLANGSWGMITLTADGTNRVIYINGIAAATGPSRTASLTNSFGFNIGGGGIFDTITANGNWFNGDIDEVALFDKALTASQVNALYAIGAFGTTTAPFIVTQPASLSAAAGSTATLSVVANGSLPLSYQWKKGGTPITGSALSIANVYYTDAGNYSVQVTNNNGLTNSAVATLTVLPVPSFANQTNGLVLHLRFDGTFSDSSGRTNDATAQGSTPGFIAGKIGQGVNINTSPGLNYLTVDDPTGDFVFDSTNSFTVAFWLSFTAGFNDVPIIGNAVNSTYQPGWVITEDANQFEWTVVGIASAGQVIADPVGGPIINNGAWRHLAVSFNRDSQTAASYVDGVLIDKRSISGLGSLATGYTLTIGQDPTGQYGSANFNLDDLGIWRRALTDYEVLSVYNAAQVAGESFDVYGPIKVYVNHVGTNVDVSWQAGTLLQSTSVTGPYTTVSGATPPFYRTTASGPAKFFRVQQ